jgi:hypothetical protein
MGIASTKNIIPGALNPIGRRDRFPETGRLETAIRDSVFDGAVAEEVDAHGLPGDSRASSLIVDQLGRQRVKAQVTAIPSKSAKITQLPVTTVEGAICLSSIKRAGSHTVPSVGVKWFIQESG